MCERARTNRGEHQMIRYQINNYSVHCVRALLCASCEKKKKKTTEKCPSEKGRKGRTVRRVVCSTVQFDSFRNGVVGWPEKADASKRVHSRLRACLFRYCCSSCVQICSIVFPFILHLVLVATRHSHANGAHEKRQWTSAYR